jgi:hypothetical protein
MYLVPDIFGIPIGIAIAIVPSHILIPVYNGMTLYGKFVMDVKQEEKASIAMPIPVPIANNLYKKL